MHIVIQTETGSIYRMGRTNGVWWFSGDNVVTEDSKDIRGDKWAIERPTPVTVGESLVVYADRRLPKDDPARMPGGGKITSRIVSMDLVP